MKLEEILELWDADSEILAEDIGGESLRTTKLHSKYLKMYVNESAYLEKYTNDYKILYKKKWCYYRGTMTQEELLENNWEQFQIKILKQDVDIYLDGDEELNSLRLKKSIQNEKVKSLDQIIKMINIRNFSIKNHIEWKKFENGIN